MRKLQQHGHNAEKQMAFYLKRAFQDSKDIFVINDLRLKTNDGTTQIDHLVVHKFGFIVIESKSVTSKISINEYGEWIRHYSKYSKGMPSPINQARRQADFLKNYLTPHSEQLLRKTLIFKASLSDFKFDILVAISDDGIIDRGQNTITDGVYKADQITDNVNRIISTYADVNNNVFSLNVNIHFSESSANKITQYLIKSHQPGVNTQTRKAVKEPIKTLKSVLKITTLKPKPLTTNKISKKIEIKKECRYCCSKNINITYGKYGYYFKCLDCQKNTPIKIVCEHNTCQPKLRKQNNQFYQECGACHTSVLYFKNKNTKTIKC